MGYVPEVPSNARFHKKYHDRVVNGILAPRRKAEEVIWENDPFRVGVINSESPFPLRFRAQVIGSCAHNDNTCSSYDFPPFGAEGMPPERNTHAFVLHERNRAIGLVTAQRATHVWKCTWKQYDNENYPLEELPGHPPIWTIAFAWIHRRFRGQRLAPQVIANAVAFLGTSVESVGWQTPFTKPAETMIRRLCPTEFYIAK